MIRRRPLLRMLVLALALGLVSAACGDDGGGDDPDPSTTTPATATTTTAPGGGGGGDQGVAVRVYFAADEKVATSGATATPPAVARGAVEALLDGPDPGAGTGQSTEIPDGTRLLGVAIDGRRATVDLSGEFDDGGGSLSMQVRAAQVVFTLTQFDSVDTVAFRLDGEAITALGGEGVDVDDVDRSDFAAVTPLVLVESPVPGEVVTSPLEVSGMANTFEANVQYTVVDGVARVVDDGFTTATAGNGTFGTFSLTSTFADAQPGTGQVVAFEESAQDGGRINSYEVPVVFP